jgi:predicted porin
MAHRVYNTIEAQNLFKELTMQKPSHLLLALLAVVGSSAALAQSSVTLYGRLNTSVEHQKIGDATVNGLANNSSRFGFKGVEDLGGGLKAGFVLESGFDSSSGAAAKSFFGRQSEVNLSGGFGMLRLGNMPAASNDATADIVSMHNHDTGSSADALYAYVMRDVNKVSYRTPVMGGLDVEAAVSLHEQATGGKNAFDLAANYNLGALGLGAGYTKLGDINQFALRASYTMGPFVAAAYYQRDENGFVVDGGKRDTFRVSGAYMMGASEFHLNVGHAGKYKNVADSSATQYTIAYNYNLSKRTKLYTYYTKVDNKVNASYGTGVDGADFSSFALGVRHNF